MVAQYSVIEDWIARWKQHFVEPIVFGTTQPQQIAELLDDFCRKELGVSIADYLFYASSLGAVCGVRLADGRRIVLKVHQPSHSHEFLTAVLQVQRYLYEQGYPCPKTLLDPRSLARATATIEELVDEGDYRQAQDPGIRRSMAELLARLIKLTEIPDSIPGLQPTSLDLRLPSGVTWPTPHSKLFDFEATAAGAEWIDEIAREAQASKLQGVGRLVIGHMDWGVKHFRYVGERVRIIYDWDSLVLEKEPIIVGHAASYFTYTEFFGDYRLPTPEEAHAFIADYQEARGRPFTAEEQQTLQAGQVYSLAYSARCEHALAPHEVTYPEGSSRWLLKRWQSQER